MYSMSGKRENSKQMNSFDLKKEEKQLHQAIASTIIDGIVVVDEESTIMFANKPLGDMFGYDTQELTGQSLTMLMPEHYRPLHRSAMKRYVKTGERHISWKKMIMPGLHKNGNEITLEITFNEFFLNDKRLFAGIIHDITEHKQIEKSMDALKSFTFEIQNHKDMQNILERALCKICEASGCCYGEVWIPQGSALVPATIWFGKEKILKEFREETEKYEFESGTGFPGKIWATKELQRITDINTVDKTDFVRVEVAKKAGLKSGVGVPVLIDDKVFAVLTFFMFNPYSENDKKFEEFITAIAAEIGMVYKRNWAEEELRQKEQHFKAIVDTATDAIITIDEDGVISFANFAAENIFGYKSDELLDRTISTIMPEYLRAIHPATLRDIVEQNYATTETNIELFGQHKSGKLIPLEISFCEFAQDEKRFYTSIIKAIKYHKI